jgi:hypothetical protein
VVIGFNRFRPELHHKMPDQKDETHAFPTPRAWEKVSRIAATPREVRLRPVAGLVGDAAAGEFEAFVRIYEAVRGLIMSSSITSRSPRLVPSVGMRVAGNGCRTWSRLIASA